MARTIAPQPVIRLLKFQTRAQATSTETPEIGVLLRAARSLASTDPISLRMLATTAQRLARRFEGGGR